MVFPKLIGLRVLLVNIKYVLFVATSKVQPFTSELRIPAVCFPERKWRLEWAASE